MAEYIEREALLEKRWDVPFETEDSHFVQVVDVGDIIAAQAADVAPVRHGNWDSSGKYEFANGELAIRCSECGCSLRQDEYKAYHWNYCPVCGARMDGGGDG